MQSRAREMSGLTTVVDRIRYWARTDPEREAFVFRRQDGGRYPLSRAAYLRLATRFAARLQSLGLQPGDVVCNFLVNSPERAVTDLGIMLSGATPMNGAPLLADGADVKGCLRKGQTKALLVDPDQKDGAWEVCQRVLDPCQPGPCQSADLPDLKQVLYSRRSEQGAMLLLEELEASTDQFRPVDIKPEDVAYIFTTSGTTGFSKLVIQTHQSLLTCTKLLRATCPVTEQDIFLSDASMGWIGGFPNHLIECGTARVMLDRRAGMPDDMIAYTWNTIREENVTIPLLSSVQVDMLLKRPELWKNSGLVLEQVLMGGQPLSKSNLAALKQSGGFIGKIFSVYGSTEMGVAFGHVVEKEDDYEEFLVGESAPGFQVKVVDANMKALPAGEHGEVVVKPASLFGGYLGDPDQTQMTFTPDGWLRSGDLGYLDQRGRLFVMGRQCDAITRGAFIVYPQWLEVRLRQCPGVKDAVVVPVPDEVLFNEVCACIIRGEGSDVTEKDVHNYCEALFVPGVSEGKRTIPRYFLFFEQFPVNKNLKLDRKELAQRAAEMLSLK